MRKKFVWENNAFWKEIKERLQRTWSVFSGLPMENKDGIWTQRCSQKGAGQLMLLQNKYITVDVNDRGFGICPMILNGRYYGRIGFDIEYGNGIARIGPWEGKDDDPKTSEAVSSFEYDSFMVSGRIPECPDFRIRTTVPASFPFIITDLNIGCLHADEVIIRPWILCPLEAIAEMNDSLWLKPAHFPLSDKMLANNNSVTADPPRESDDRLAGIGIACEEGKAVLSGRKTLGPEGKQITLCDRWFDENLVQELMLSPVKMPVKDGRASLSIIIGICRDEAEFRNAMDIWRSLPDMVKVREKQYWSGILKKLKIRCPDHDIGIQSRYSIKNSLFSRSVYDKDKTIFIHGRPDRGYGDCSKLHQSYQMYYTALASGEAGSVKSELLAFAKLQLENGDMAIQLRPGSGWHPYAGLYSNAHFILAVYRYLCWTGDLDFTYQIIDSAKQSADWLLENRSDGLIKPCGWLDAWPPKVKAQAQISIVTCMALKELALIFNHIGQTEEEKYYASEAARLEKNIRDVFYNVRTGLFAEHLFDEGNVEGGSLEDFWAHTQIWTALAGLVPDTRGLEACRKYCLKNGMAIIPETGLETDYIKDSTDGLEELDLGSTATWLLAAWPEVTHLYALSEIKYGRINEAYDAVKRQLPKNVHLQNPYASPCFYPEKYLYPYDIPWLCTWSGDPTLIQVLMEGFGGIRASLEGLSFKPSVPEEWKGKEFTVDFIWRGFPICYTIQGSGSWPEDLLVNGHEQDANTVVTPEILNKGSINNIVIKLK